MLSIKNLSETDFQTLKELSRATDPTSVTYGGHTVQPVDPQLKLGRLEETVANIERKAGFSTVQNVGGQLDLSTSPLVWLASKLDSVRYSTISNAEIRKNLLVLNLKRVLRELDTINLPLEQKIKMVEMVQVSSNELDEKGQQELGGVLKEKVEELKQQQVSDTGTSVNLKLLEELKIKSAQLRKNLGLEVSSGQPKEIPARPVTPPVSKRLNLVCGSFADHLRTTPYEVHHQLKEYCRSLLNGTAVDDKLVVNGVYQGRSYWPSAEDLKAFIANNDQDFPLKKQFLALAARCFKVPVECEIHEGNKVIFRRFAIDGRIAPLPADNPLRFRLAEEKLSDEYFSLRNDDFDEAPKSLVPHHHNLPAVKPGRSQEQIMLDRRITAPGEYEGIVQAWGKDSSKLNSPDFPDQYRRLKLIFIESNKAGRRFSFEHLAMIHKSGLLDYYQERIDRARPNTDDMTIVYQDLEKDFGLSVFGIKEQCVNAESGVTASLVGPPMKNWAQNCWANSANQMLMAMIDAHAAEQISQKVFTGPYSQERRAVRDATLALWRACEDIRTGKERPHSVAGYQLNLMRALHDLGAKDFTCQTIRDAFEQAIPLRQEDPQEYISEMCNLLGMNTMPEYSINSQTRIMATVNGKQISRPCGSANPSCLITMPRPDKPSTLNLLDKSLTYAYPRMYDGYILDEHQQVRSGLHTLNQAIANYREEDGEKEIRTARSQLVSTLKQMANRCVDYEQPIVYESQDRYGQRVLVLKSDLQVPGGEPLRKGTILSYAPKPPDGVCGVQDLGPGHKNVKICMNRSDGSLTLHYTDRSGNEYFHGVAVTDLSGRLARPFLSGRQDPRYYDERLCYKHPPGTEIYTSKGETIAPRVSGGYQYPEGKLVIKRELVDLIKKTGLESLQLADTRLLCQEIAGMMCVPEHLDMTPVEQSFRPSTISGSMDTLLKGLKVVNGWDKEDFDKAGLNITDWYPTYLEQQKLVKETVIAEAQANGCQTLEQCYQWHHDNKSVKKEVKIVGTTANTLGVNTARNKQFMISLKMFESDGMGGQIKTGKDAKEIYASMGNKISLPVTDEYGNETTVEGRVKHLVCHQGRSAEYGHYISLRFLPGGRINVEDDTNVMELNDYLKIMGSSESTYNKSVPEILEMLHIEPYIMLFERDEQ